MKRIGDRITFVDNKDNLSFVVYPPNLGKKKLLIVIWLALWILIGIYMAFQFLREFSSEEKIALVIFMFFWAYFALRVFKTVLYLYYGKEYIKLDQNSLKVKHATGSYGKANQFFIENISKIRTVTFKPNSFKKAFEDSAWVKGTNRIEFEYFNKKYGFGRKLDEKDAEMVYKILIRRIDKFLKSKKKNS